MGDLGGGQRNLNESAHEAARGLISRAPSQPPLSQQRAFKDQLQTYNELTKHLLKSTGICAPTERTQQGAVSHSSHVTNGLIPQSLEDEPHRLGLRRNCYVFKV
ncbi:hypothetical protein HPB48_012870 [Haemaphysalis longicornis]|uniref:Uncharacterized protein n=1 Tax=Haemaphysalis longicornis TaxID=44386 RepID=A0A9J6GDI2_HAELO|nr:hypothetical protein HPB48_012870 [Haemaphysalis longicornis]